MEKQQIRQAILKKLKAQREELRQKKSLNIKKQLFSQPPFITADTVMFYIAKDGEVDTTAMIKDALEMGKKVVVPVTLVKEKKIIPSQMIDYPRELEEGPYGIYQPKRRYVRKVPLKDIDVIIVPGIAFDRKGNRLGRGGGYFDRFLAKLKKRNIPMFGIAFKFQILKQIPVFFHDIPVDKLIYA
ncbi:MAG: 5-formyltetrahydrofolate cyclo-ligase [Candidatus Omnitrophica bacterium]|nr:5-formyltetrahydrofolate cyclo-ligase [Candidatus Omnitrophota bacterium]MBU4478781.1 5-formyltetrahydrofolate cyclo-ligase [Candidatus Omnitrophota bacterium]